VSYQPEPLFVEIGPKIEPVTKKPATIGERQRARIATGMHPLAGVGQIPRLVGLAEEGTGTCGECVHRRRPSHRSRSYPKCDAGAVEIDSRTVWPRASHSETTDCRSWWPACPQFEAKGGDRD